MYPHILNSSMCSMLAQSHWLHWCIWWWFLPAWGRWSIAGPWWAFQPIPNKKKLPHPKFILFLAKGKLMNYVHTLKVSKYRKQNTKFSHPPKNQRNFVHFFASASKSGWIKKLKALYRVKEPLITNSNHQIPLFFVSTTF